MVIRWNSLDDLLGLRSELNYAFRDIYNMLWSVYDKDSFSSYNGCKIELAPDLLPARLHRASHRYRGGHGFESRRSLRIFLGFICNCLGYFRTAKISFTSTLLFIHVQGNISVCLVFDIFYWKGGGGTPIVLPSYPPHNSSVCHNRQRLKTLKYVCDKKCNRVFSVVSINLTQVLRYLVPRVAALLNGAQCLQKGGGRYF